MAIKYFLILYILFVVLVSVLSPKKGFYLTWITILLTPPIILLMQIKLYLSLMSVLMLVSICFGLRSLEYKSFIKRHQFVISIYFIVTIATILFSETVPIKNQFPIALAEMVTLMFAAFSYLLLRENQQMASTMLKIVSVVILFNVIFCAVFEIIIGVNPMGLPLYMMLGLEDNAIDMIEVERGMMSFRLQSIYGHPLSLGQYMLILLPLFFMNFNIRFRFLLIFFVCIMIGLTGTRGAIAPMILVVLFCVKRITNHLLPNIMIASIVVIIALALLPDKTGKEIDEKVEAIVAGLQIWDDQKQEENDISGSSLEMRIDQWGAAQKEISGNPLFGRGMGYREYWQNKHNTFHPDLLGYESVLLYYVVERGWLGLLFFFVMVYYLYKLFRNDTIEKKIILMIFMGYLLSITMTGVRPLSLLLVCLSSSLVCGMMPVLSENENSVDTLIEEEA